MVWIISVLVVLGLLVTAATGVLVWRMRKKKKQKTDYRALFNMGIVFTPVGIALAISTENPGMIGLTAMGLIYMAIGLKNKDKWKKRS